MSKASPVETLQTPDLEASVSEEQPPHDGLIIGITCGVIGFLIVVIVFLVIGIKLRRKKKERDDGAYYETSSNSNAQLLAEGNDLHSSILHKYAESFDIKKSASCPDIYQVNKSILLKIGPTALAYEELEQSSMSGSIRHKSDEFMASYTTNITEISRTSSKSGKDERDGRIFEDGDIYHIPSISNTFRRQSDGKIRSSKQRDELLLISNGNKIPLYVESNKDDNEGEYYDIPAYQTPNSNLSRESQIENHLGQDAMNPTGYQTPTRVSRQASQADDQHGNHETNSTGYQTPTSNSTGYQTPTTNSPTLMAKNAHVESSQRMESGLLSRGYLKPTSNSPKLFPKPSGITPDQIRNELYVDDDLDNIYDIPKFNDPYSAYSNIPKKAESYDGDNKDKQATETEARYKVPLNVVPDYSQRSKSIGSAMEKSTRPQLELYDVPSNSQPSLLKPNPMVPKYAEIPSVCPHEELDSPGDMIYDVPSRCHTLERTTLLRSTSKDNPVYIPNLNPSDNEKPNHTYIDIDKLNINGERPNPDVKKRIEDVNINNEIDREDLDMIYDVPSRSHAVERTSFPKSPTKEQVDKYHPKTLDIEKHNYMAVDQLNIKKKNHSNGEGSDRRGSNDSNKSNNIINDSVYDVPSARLDSPTLPVKEVTYLNVTPSNIEKRKNVALIKKIGYDVPSTTPVFDPSQPSLLKLASKNLYKNIETSSLNKFGVGKTSYEKQGNIPEYDPSQSFSRTPVNKKINNNQGNRSKHFDEEDMVYDIPSSNKSVSSDLVSNDTASSEKKTMTQYDVDENESEAIYQNVFHTEDGLPFLRPYKSPNQT